MDAIELMNDDLALIRDTAARLIKQNNDRAVADYYAVRFATPERREGGDRRSAADRRRNSGTRRLSIRRTVDRPITIL